MNAEKLSQVSLYKTMICTAIPLILFLFILEIRGIKRTDEEKAKNKTGSYRSISDKITRILFVPVL